MDRALIERMVGATVLVLLLVIVAPALLDGSRPDPKVDSDPASGPQTRTEVILLTEPAARSARNEPAEAAVAESPLRQPEPQPKPEPERVTSPATEQVVSDPAPRPAPAPEKVAARVAEGYAVQLGSFREQANAGQFAAGLKQQGFAVFVKSADSPAGVVYRVYAGPRPTRDAAEKLTATLAKAGYKGMVVEASSN